VSTEFEIDPKTGEVFPLTSDVFLAHYDFNMVPLGIWRISEAEQVPMYREDNGSAQEGAQAAFESRKGTYTSWASVVDRILYSSDAYNRWGLLDNSDNKSLLELARDLGIR